VPLKKVLKRACGGILPDCRHLEFIGADTYFKKGHVFNYAVSVPWRKVRQNEEVLLAWEMNGQPLPKIHGGPLRVVVTGFIGARSCKWVYKINALPEPSMGPVQRQEYLYYNQQAGLSPCVSLAVMLIMCTVGQAECLVQQWLQYSSHACVVRFLI
jgi:sulfite oxidase